MKFGDITNRLSGKQRLREAKLNEDLDNLVTLDKQLLTDDQLGSVAGGGGNCYWPKLCPDCGKSLKFGKCAWCGFVDPDPEGHNLTTPVFD